MQFKSLDDLSEDMIQWLPSIPREIDLVVGVPRSGMLPATLLALQLHKPLASVTDYLNERIMGAGHRLQCSGFSLRDADTTVLVLDDSVYAGRQMMKTRRRIEAHAVGNRVLYGAPYVAPGAEDVVDLYYEVVPMPRVFEWNVLHHSVLSNACVNIDGVLCRNPTDKENDDEAAYRTFLRTAEPLFLPEKSIRCLVTSRVEKYRALTEAWLERHGVAYDHLIMMDYPAMEARRTANRYAEHKAEAYVSTKAELFVESSRQQAVDIVRLAGKPVYCVATREMITPSKLSPAYMAVQARARQDRIKHLLWRVWKTPEKVPGKLLERFQRLVPGLGETSSNGRDAPSQQRGDIL